MVEGLGCRVLEVSRERAVCATGLTNCKLQPRRVVDLRVPPSPYRNPATFTLKLLMPIQFRNPQLQTLNYRLHSAC